MLKIFIALVGAAFLAVPSHSQAQGTRSNYNGGGRSGAVRSEARSDRGGRSYAYRGAYRGGYGSYGGHHYGRYYFLGGIPYFYPFFGSGLGFGYPAYAYDGYWNGYAGAPYGYGAGGPEGAPEGQATAQGAPDEQKGGALPSAVQRQLMKRGYYKGSVDGDFGPASRAALSRFQRDNQLKDTGRIDEDSLEALGFADHR